MHRLIRLTSFWQTLHNLLQNDSLRWLPTVESSLKSGAHRRQLLVPIHFLNQTHFPVTDSKKTCRGLHGHYKTISHCSLRLLISDWRSWRSCSVHRALLNTSIGLSHPVPFLNHLVFFSVHPSGETRVYLAIFSFTTSHYLWLKGHLSCLDSTQTVLFSWFSPEVVADLPGTGTFDVGHQLP